MKIFEIREYIDGGPNDRGFEVGYIKTDKTREQLREEQGHGFIDYVELTEEQFLKRKTQAENYLKTFNI